jgi:DNA-binding beta-propeller fold protein YncE
MGIDSLYFAPCFSGYSGGYSRGYGSFTPEVSFGSNSDAVKVTMNDSGISIYKGLPDIKRVIFNDPATIVFWSDGTKTIVKCQKENGDTYSKETGLAMAISKKAYGNKGRFNDVFTKWLEEK